MIHRCSSKGQANYEYNFIRFSKRYFLILFYVCKSVYVCVCVCGERVRDRDTERGDRVQEGENTGHDRCEVTGQVIGTGSLLVPCGSEDRIEVNRLFA